MLRLVPRSPPSRALTLAVAVRRARAHRALRRDRLFAGARPCPPAAGAGAVLRRAVPRRRRLERAGGQGDAAGAGGAGAGDLFSRQRLEHRRRRAVHRSARWRATAVAMHATRGRTPLVILPAIALAGRRSAAWPGRRSVAFLRDRFHANEILVSLMLVYVADMLLGYLVYGPWKIPTATTSRRRSASCPSRRFRCSPKGTRARRLVRGAGRGRRWPGCSCFATYGGFQLAVGGQAPRGRALRRLLGAPRALDGAALLGRPGRAGRRAGGDRTARAAHAAPAGRLRVHRDHRGVRRAAAPVRHPAVVDL